MTDAEIDALDDDDLRVAYAEQVEGWEYRGGKTRALPWYKNGYPLRTNLPHYLGWSEVLDAINLMLNDHHPFLPRYCRERMTADVTFDFRGYAVKLSLLPDDGHDKPMIQSWSADGSCLGVAFLRSMLRVARWFREHRGWSPAK